MVMNNDTANIIAIFINRSSTTKVTLVIETITFDIEVTISIPIMIAALAAWH